MPARASTRRWAQTPGTDRLPASPPPDQNLPQPPPTTLSVGRVTCHLPDLPEVPIDADYPGVGRMTDVSEQPGRYSRSFGGMMGALIVTVVVVVAFVTWRSLFRGDTDDTTPYVDWRGSVEVARGADLRVVHPRELPAGWTATSVDLRAGDDPRWGLGVLTDDGRFIGVRQQDASATDLVELYVDEKAEPGPDATVESELGDTWQTWSDAGGDHGFSTELGSDAVLVYGSAPVEDIETYLGLLTR